MENNEEFIEALLKLKEYQELERKEERKARFYLLYLPTIIAFVICILYMIFL